MILWKKTKQIICGGHTNAHQDLWLSSSLGTDLFEVRHSLMTCFIWWNERSDLCHLWVEVFKSGVRFSIFSFFTIVIVEACVYHIGGEEERPKHPGILNDQIQFRCPGDSHRLKLDIVWVRNKLLMCLGPWDIGT